MQIKSLLNAILYPVLALLSDPVSAGSSLIGEIKTVLPHSGGLFFNTTGAPPAPASSTAGLLM